MVVAQFWWGVVLFAFTMTAAWLFIEKRVTTTALLAGAGWSFAFFTGVELVHRTETGATYTTSAGTVRYFALFLALLSFVVLILYRFGHYPPEDDQLVGEMSYE